MRREINRKETLTAMKNPTHCALLFFKAVNMDVLVPSRSGGYQPSEYYTIAAGYSQVSGITFQAGFKSNPTLGTMSIARYHVAQDVR